MRRETPGAEPGSNRRAVGNARRTCLGYIRSGILDTGSKDTVYLYNPNDGIGAVERRLPGRKLRGREIDLLIGSSVNIRSRLVVLVEAA